MRLSEHFNEVAGRAIAAYAPDEGFDHEVTVMLMPDHKGTGMTAGLMFVVRFPGSVLGKKGFSLGMCPDIGIDDESVAREFRAMVDRARAVRAESLAQGGAEIRKEAVQSSGLILPG